jgi:hypothetical protein
MRIFHLLSAMPMRVVSGRSRLMRAGFPTGTRGRRSSEEAHSLLGRRACSWPWEIVASAKTLCYLLNLVFWASISCCNTKKYWKEAPDLTEYLTSWTFALMVDRRPRMRKSRQNATVLIFMCLIWRSDVSRVSSLISVIGYLGFSYKQSPWPSLSPFFLSPMHRLPLHHFFFFLSFSTPRRTGRRLGSQLGTGTNWFVLLPLGFT